jgi:cellulose synthase/poly-beta-1,6-N-acetylglucosamine synthase-like glycosyltransferase
MKTKQLKHRFYTRLRLKESWVIFFILGIIMMNYPFIHIFNKNAYVFGFPLLFVYLIGGWAFSILVICLFTKAIKPDSDNDSGSDRT